MAWFFSKIPVYNRIFNKLILFEYRRKIYFFKINFSHIFLKFRKHFSTWSPLNKIYTAQILMMWYKTDNLKIHWHTLSSNTKVWLSCGKQSLHLKPITPSFLCIVYTCHRRFRYLLYKRFYATLEIYFLVWHKNHYVKKYFVITDISTRLFK